MKKKFDRPILITLALLALLVWGLTIIPLAYGQTLSFEKTWGGPGSDYGESVALDSSGNIYLTGSTGSFGAGGLDLVLLKYGPAGNLLWEKTWGGGSWDLGRDVAADFSGNVYVTGYTWSFPLPGWPRSPTNVVLLKFDFSGNLQWQKMWGWTRYEIGAGVAVDSSGNIYVTGSTESYGFYGEDVFLLKYDPAGNLLWQKTWGYPVYHAGCAEVATDVALDSSDNIYIAGYTEGFAEGGYNIAFLKYDSSGNLLWEKTWGGGGWDLAYGVALDSSDNIYLTGSTSSFGAGGSDLVLLKYDPAGNLLWEKTWGSPGNEVSYGVAVNSVGNIYVTGHTDSFGAGSYEAILLEYDSAGNLIGQSTWGGPGLESGWGGLALHNRDLCLTGFTTSASRAFTNVAGTIGTPEGIVDSVEGTLPDSAGVLPDPSGTVGIASGSETYAGGYDIFLLKFEVGKKSPPEATEDLISDIIEMELPGGTENSLTSKLENVIRSLEDGQDNTAANKLEAFISQVEALRGKKLTEEQADYLIEKIREIIEKINS